MEIVHVYTKKRSEFGRQCFFSNRPGELHANIAPEPHLISEFIDRDPCDTAVQCTQELSEHEVCEFVVFSTYCFVIYSNTLIACIFLLYTM